VGAVLVGLVQFGAFAYVLPGPGAIFFAAVVVLTMLASASFDPRLTWDPLQEEQARER
jgi:paraquat-inducible protein A